MPAKKAKKNAVRPESHQETGKATRRNNVSRDYESEHVGDAPRGWEVFIPFAPLFPPLEK